MILETLLSRQIPFAVNVSAVTVKGLYSNNEKQYSIAVAAADSDLVEGLGFQVQGSGHRAVICRNCNAEEEQRFKSRQQDFRKVEHSADGRVYEVKGMPLRQRIYEADKKEMLREMKRLSKLVEKYMSSKGVSAETETALNLLRYTQRVADQEDGRKYHDISKRLRLNQKFVSDRIKTKQKSA